MLQDGNNTYEYDAFRRTSKVTTKAGLTQINRYDAFGNTIEAEEQIPNRYQYTGQQLDPLTQQYYLRARFYNLATARFTQEDEYHGDGLNLYAYCANDPVDYYEQYDWDRRFQNRRQRGVKRFWRGEKNKINNNKRTIRDWNERQKGDILRGKVPKDNNNKPMEGHHKYNAADYPHLADDERNIYPVTREEHQYRWHGGKWTNDTSGKPLDPDYPEEIFRE